MRVVTRVATAALAVLALSGLGLSSTSAQTRGDSQPAEDVREICSIAFDLNPVRPARLQNNALPCLKQAAQFLSAHPDRKLVAVGAKDPQRDHEPAYVDSAREEEDATGFAVRLEDLSAYRAVNAKWYLVHYLHSKATRILPTTDEMHFAQSVTFYDVPGTADFNHNLLNTTKINELPCTVQPCYPRDEETLKAQPRERIMAGAAESTGDSIVERRVLAAQRRRSSRGAPMSADADTLAPLPPPPTPQNPATASIIPQ